MSGLDSRSGIQGRFGNPLHGSGFMRLLGALFLALEGLGLRV